MLLALREALSELSDEAARLHEEARGGDLEAFRTADAVEQEL